MTEGSSFTCKTLYGVGLNQKRPTSLPSDENLVNRFLIGVDLYAPIHVKLGGSDVKRYGCIYTCLTTRAIHLEVLNNLESDTFINGFVRFICRRGCPTKVWSDNGTTLVGSRAELSRSLRQLDHEKVVRAARRQEVDWTFNPPLASHHGGVWEGMIRTVRRVMVAVLNYNTIMTHDILYTVLCEVENDKSHFEVRSKYSCYLSLPSSDVC